MIKNSLDLGIIVLCPNREENKLRITTSSIEYNSYNRDIIAVVGNDASPHDFKKFKEYCPTYKGKGTMASLINTGFKRLKNEWGLLVISGGRFRQFTERRLSLVEHEKEIIFPVVDKNYNFLEASLDGILINKKTFEDIGDWPEDEEDSLEYSKLVWAATAKERGCKFKAIVGLRII